MTHHSSVHSTELASGGNSMKRAKKRGEKKKKELRERESTKWSETKPVVEEADSTCCYDIVCTASWGVLLSKKTTTTLM